MKTIEKTGRKLILANLSDKVRKYVSELNGK